MSNTLFKNAIDHKFQDTPPIWFMRQAGRYHSHYKKLKEKYSFEELCKIPELASEVACGPVKEFDFDVAILFSDILFPLEGLGMHLKFNPGPIFDEFVTKENFHKYSNTEKAIQHMEFQKNAIKITKQKLPNNKSLIGFVGGLWTLLKFAINKKNSFFQFNDFHYEFMQNILLRVIKQNIQLQLDAGVEIVMIFDSGLGDLSSKLFEKKYFSLIKNLADSFPHKLGYYCKGRSKEEVESLLPLSFAGFGIDSNLDINHFFSKSSKGFIQGNFDESKMLLDKDTLIKEINIYCDHIESNNLSTGWVCGLGHGINKLTPEKNVHLFIDIIRKRFK